MFLYIIKIMVKKKLKKLPIKEEYTKLKKEKINDWNLVLHNKMDKYIFDEKWYGVKLISNPKG
jgi:hypothetical protein